VVTASKDNPFNDVSVCVTALAQGKQIYIIDVFRARLKFHLLKAKSIELARTHGAKVLLIEDALSGTALIQSLRAEDPQGVPVPIPRRSEGDKITWALNAGGMIQTGRLFLSERAHWLGDFPGELLWFGRTAHHRVEPPSITSSRPVTQTDRSDARYKTPFAISSGWPTRPSGFAAFIWAMAASASPVSAAKSSSILV